MSNKLVFSENVKYICHIEQQSLQNMESLSNIRFIIVVFYIILFAYLFPKSGTTYDLFKLRLRLYPYWMKFVSIALILSCLIIIVVIDNFLDERIQTFIAIVNLSLFVLVFSKEKYEDEFSEQIRFKSFTYAFLTFLAFSGVFGAASIGKLESVYIPNSQYIQVMIGLSLLVSLTYFYYTKYRIQKGNR